MTDNSHHLHRTLPLPGQDSGVLPLESISRSPPQKAPFEIIWSWLCTGEIPIKEMMLCVAPPELLEHPMSIIGAEPDFLSPRRPSLPPEIRAVQWQRKAELTVRHAKEFGQFRTILPLAEKLFEAAGRIATTRGGSFEVGIRILVIS
jgi:hypothetical protein